MKKTWHLQRSLTQSCQRHQSTKPTSNTPKLVIFDQNGTLLSLQQRWVPWAKQVSERLANDAGQPVLESELLKTLGFRDGQLGPGVLAEGSTTQIANHLTFRLERAGVEATRAVRCVQHVVRTEPSGPVKPLAGVKHVFRILKEAGILTAVCTSDSRSRTKDNLDQVGVAPEHVDALLCSDDPSYKPKPNPSNIYELCRHLSVSPEETVLVGDNLCDINMGRDAQVLSSIGVLTGVTPHAVLFPHADTLLTSLHQLLPSVMPPQEEEYWHKYMHPYSGSEPQAPAKLVVFDKDGTLLCFDSLWVPWIEGTAQRLEDATGLELRNELKELYGCDVVTNRCGPGLLAEGTAQMLQDATVDLLVQKGLKVQEAQDVLACIWQECNVREKGNLRVLGDAHNVLRSLKRDGVQIAVCTMDSRIGCESFLRESGLEKYVDTTVCGNDPQILPKPDASMGLEACKQLGVQPQDALIIGDTEADMGLGEAAHFKSRVGVLSGVGRIMDVGPKATHVVNCIDDVLAVALPHKYSHSTT